MNGILLLKIPTCVLANLSITTLIYFFLLKSPLFQALINSPHAKGFMMFMGGTWPA